MNAINATWTHGQIVPAEPVDWPEGTELLVAKKPEKIGLTEAEWPEDPKSIAEWIAWVDSIEPLDMSEEERSELERWRQEMRRFNIEAVRKQMGLDENWAS